MTPSSETGTAILFCAFWLTTSQAYSVAMHFPQKNIEIQVCMANHAREEFYTDKCISKAYPKKTLLVDKECVMMEGRGGCNPTFRLIRNGSFVLQ